MKFIKIKLLMIITILTLTSCSYLKDNVVNGENTKPIDYTTEETKLTSIVRLKTLNMSIRPYQTLNPLLVKDKNIANTLNLIYDKLFVYDETLKAVPELCEDYIFDLERNAYIISLKQGVFFSNGEQLKEEDVIYSLDVLRAQEDDVYYKSAIKNVRNYYIDKDGKIIIELLAGSSMLETSLVFPIISKEEYIGDYHSLPLGTGVYKMDKQSAYHKFTLNENIYSEKVSKISQINVEAVENEKIEVTAFESGIFDIAFSNINNWVSYKKSHDSFVSKVDTNALEFIGFNYDNMFLSDVVVREALKYSVPYNKILDDVYLGFGSISNTGVNPKSWLYNEVSKGANFDLEYAKKILKSSGYIYDEEQKVFTSSDESKTPLAFNLIVNEENDERLDVAKFFKEELETIGIQINIISLDYDNYIEALNNKDFDIFLGGFTQNTIQTYDGIFLEGQPFEIKDEDFINLYNNLFVTETQGTFKNAHHMLQTYVLENVSIIPIVFKEDAVLTKGENEKALFSFENYFYNIEDWEYNMEVVK